MTKPMLMLLVMSAYGVVPGWAAAQSPPPAAAPETKPANPGPKAARPPRDNATRVAPRAPGEQKVASTPAPGRGAIGMRGMGMGMGMEMGGMCPLMVGTDAKVQVQNLPKGVTITWTSDDANTVARLQKAAEGMRLMHEAHAR